MRFPWSDHPPLKGAAVFLSGSVPDPRRDRCFLAGPLDELLMLRVIEQRVFASVQSLVAQVLTAGGRVVHGGHPTITQALASQAANWEVPAAGDPPILLYQSTLFRKYPAPPGRETMVEQGFATVRWSPATLQELTIGGRSLLTTAGGPIAPEWITAWLPHQAAPGASPERREALLAMRLQMLLDTQPCLAVCVGGMEGIKAEAGLWTELCRHGLLAGSPRIQAITSTFGATDQLDALPHDRVEFLEGYQAFTAAAASPETAPRDLLQPLSYDGLMRKLVAGIGQLE